ncbi:MAG: BNR-4 repeat-containing protein [Phycisphaeraceae bacterium]|nr:BNR-4 repeat-containing protein [Phycisphaeraceae bacterium]
MSLKRHTLDSASFYAVAIVGIVFLATALNPVPVRGQPVELPLVEQPHQHEAALGYAPNYVVNVPAFDSLNRPYLRSRTVDPHETGYIETLRDGQWVKLDFVAAIRDAYPAFAQFHYGGGTFGAEIVFDADDHLYTLLRIKLTDGGERELLLYSPDYGSSFQVYELPKDEPPLSRPIGFANIEQRVGHNTLTWPPLLATLSKRADNPLGKWTAHNYLDLFQPHKQDGRLVLGDPLRVTDHALIMTRQTGNPSFAVSGPDKTYIVWAETTDNDYIPGVPTFVATYDPQTRTLSDRSFVGYGYPPNDGHNTPGIVIDSQGYLHTLTGSHGENFMYSHSLEPYSTARMSEPAPSLKHGWIEHDTDRGRQTYVSFVCGADDALHTVFRQWFKGTQPWFTDTYFGGLAYQRKAPGQPWDEHSRLMIVPPLDGYSIYYQNLAIDRHGRLFLSYGYRSDQQSYGTGEAENHYMALLMSADSGQTWRLVTTADFAQGIDAAVNAGNEGK